jgi:hypothetical protein
MSIGNIVTTATTGLQNSAKVVQESAQRIVQRSATSSAVDGTEGAGGTVQSSSINATPDLIQGQESSLESDLIQNAVRIRQAETVYQASASLIKTADEMSEALLDVKA